MTESSDGNRSFEIQSILEKCLAVFRDDTAAKLSADHPLFGPDGALESIQFVSFLVLVEQEINARFAVDIRLVSERAFSIKNSPFRSLTSLREWVIENLGAEK